MEAGELLREAAQACGHGFGARQAAIAGRALTDANAIRPVSPGPRGGTWISTTAVSANVAPAADPAQHQAALGRDGLEDFRSPPFPTNVAHPGGPPNPIPPCESQTPAQSHLPESRRHRSPWQILLRRRCVNAVALKGDG